MRSGEANHLEAIRNQAPNLSLLLNQVLVHCQACLVPAESISIACLQQVRSSARHHLGVAHLHQVIAIETRLFDHLHLCCNAAIKFCFSSQLESNHCCADLLPSRTTLRRTNNSGTVICYPRCANGYSNQKFSVHTEQFFALPASRCLGNCVRISVCKSAFVIADRTTNTLNEFHATIWNIAPEEALNQTHHSTCSKQTLTCKSCRSVIS